MNSRNSFYKLCQRGLGLLLATTLAFTQAISSVAMAQIEDSENPVIIHRQADTAGTAGELQTFLARVYDDVEVIEVTLFFRQSEVAAFQQIPMRPLLDSLGEYMIAIETEVSEYPGLQYYIEAVDTAGNVTNRGFSYAPIVLPLNPPDLSAPPAPDPSPIISQAPQATPAEAPSFGSGGLLMGIGAILILGALAAGGGSGGGTGTGGDGDPPGGVTTLTIVTDAPTGN